MNERQQFISSVVNRFYQIATNDVMIGHHFRHTDMQQHMPRIIAFWEAQLLGIKSSLAGSEISLIKAHIPLKIKKGEVGRWVKLFKDVLSETARNDELTVQWLAKVEHFQQVFLHHQKLFP